MGFATLRHLHEWVSSRASFKYTHCIFGNRNLILLLRLSLPNIALSISYMVSPSKNIYILFIVWCGHIIKVSHICIKLVLGGFHIYGPSSDLVRVWSLSRDLR